MVYHEGGLPEWFVNPFFVPVVMRRNTRILAALVMYQRAGKLAILAAEPSNFVPMAELQIEAYLGAVNALSLVDQKVAWIAIPLVNESDYIVRSSCYYCFVELMAFSQPRKRRKLSKHIPEELYASGRRDMEIVSVNEIRYDYTLLSAQLELTKADPTFIVGPGSLSLPLTTPCKTHAFSGFLSTHSAIVMRLAQLNKFNTAMSTARSLDVDMAELFVHLTTQCLKLSRHPNSIPYDPGP